MATGTYIEWLKFRVQPELRSQFIAADKRIWTAALSQNPGFGRKEAWLNPDKDDEVITVIHWRDRDQWKSIPEAELARIEQTFQTALGAETYELIEAKEYRLADTPSDSPPTSPADSSPNSSPNSMEVG